MKQAVFVDDLFNCLSTRSLLGFSWLHLLLSYFSNPPILIVLLLNAPFLLSLTRFLIEDGSSRHRPPPRTPPPPGMVMSRGGPGKTPTPN